MTAEHLADKSREELVETILEMHQRLSYLERQLFGQKSERFVPTEDDEQMSLDLGVDSGQEQDVHTQHISYDRHVGTKNAGHCRGPMPTNLPIREVTLEPEDGTEGTVIGTDVTWEYQFKRGSLYIVCYSRPRYARPDMSVAIAKLPPRPIDKGNAGPSMLAHVITQKYLYHMPLDRQRRQLRAEYEVNIAESTLCDWVKRSCRWLEPVYQELVDQVQACDYVQADETPIQVLVRDKKGKSHRGYFWVYHAPLENITAFVYSKSRARAGPNKFLKAFKGTLQVDGYTGYDEVLRRSDVTWAACMAHVRRKFEEALDSDRERAGHALGHIKQWFAVEAQATEAELNHEQRLALRKAKTAQSMGQFYRWLKEQRHSVLPKSPLGKAVTYALNQWKGFEPFLEDGRIELSNNGVENKIRPVALGRKNYLFKGSHDAAQRGAVIYSLSATAQKLGIDPYLYFTDLLERRPADKDADPAGLVPAVWKQRYMDEAVKREEDRLAT